MTQKSSTAFFIGSIFIFLFSYFFPFFANAAGILSEPINVENARRGQTHWEVLVFMNSSAKDIVFDLSADGAIKDWAQFFTKDNDKDSITNLKVPANSNVEIRVKFSIPEKTSNGKYQGAVIGRTLASSAEMSGEATAQVTQRLDREVNITVTDNQVLDFNTIFIPVAYSMVKDEPLKVKLIHENRGNVDIKPNVELLVTQNGKEIFKSIFPYPSDMTAVQPNERKEIFNQVEWRTIGYEAGRYDVTLTTFEGDKLNQKEQFSIGIGKSNAVGFAFANLSDAFKNKNFIWPVVAGVIAISVLVVLLKKKKVLNSN